MRPNLAKFYRICNQTVTIYHLTGSICTGTVYHNAFLDFQKKQNVSKTGSREASSFLLVIPGAEIPVAVGDKVLMGEGPEYIAREVWSKLIPSTTPGLVVVKYVDPKYFGGQLVHTEAGG